MILGSGDSTPYDMLALVLLCILALVLLAGAIVGPGWSADAATVVRRGAMVTAIVVMVALHVITPTPDGIVGAVRLITLWPALTANALFFAVWSWRVGRF